MLGDVRGRQGALGNKKEAGFLCSCEFFAFSFFDVMNFFMLGFADIPKASESSAFVILPEGPGVWHCLVWHAKCNVGGSVSFVYAIKLLKLCYYETTE